MEMKNKLSVQEVIGAGFVLANRMIDTSFYWVRMDEMIPSHFVKPGNAADWVKHGLVFETREEANEALAKINE
jgi:hypothetical protein